MDVRSPSAECCIRSLPSGSPETIELQRVARKVCAEGCGETRQFCGGLGELTSVTSLSEVRDALAVQSGYKSCKQTCLSLKHCHVLYIPFPPTVSHSRHLLVWPVESSCGMTIRLVMRSRPQTRIQAARAGVPRFRASVVPGTALGSLLCRGECSC